MIILVLFSFIAGLVTILSPCILPLLPIILSSSNGEGKSKPLGVVVGFVGSFTFFTLFLSSIVKVTGIPAESLRSISIFILVLFGLSLLTPKVQLLIENLFSRIANLVTVKQTRSGFIGGIIIGLSLGLLWTPCVGPILASVISLAITGQVTLESFMITFAYSLGTALPMLAIMSAGSTALKKVPWLVKNTALIQKAFGILMVVTALGIYLNVDRKFQTYILSKFPNYGSGLTALEDNQQIQKYLDSFLRKSDQKITDSETQVFNKNIDQAATLPKYAKAPEIIAGGEWLNSKPLKLADLKGKVVLIDFWTYTCINCQRTLPFLRDWWSKYRDKGLVIIGVHSPEFEFEKDLTNVKQAATDFKLSYPIMQDNQFSTWRAYENRYWPAKYLIDKDGYIRYFHFGEGKYDETERAIQSLLNEIGITGLPQELAEQNYSVNTSTPETYLGYARLASLVSPEIIVQDSFSSYTKPTLIPSNMYALEGEWAIFNEYSEPKANSSLYINFSSEKVFLVMRPKSGVNSAKLRVFVDGKQQFFGSDNTEGVVEVNSARLYELVKLGKQTRHILKLEFIEGNIEVFAFTFG